MSPCPPLNPFGKSVIKTLGRFPLLFPHIHFHYHKQALRNKQNLSPEQGVAPKLVYRISKQIKRQEEKESKLAYSLRHNNEYFKNS
jgi:hypothetical protein